MSALHESALISFFLSIVCIVGFALALGAIAQRLGQAPVIGEILAGILIGPSCLSAAVPELHNLLATSGVKNGLYLLSQIGLVLLMFQFGLDFHLDHLRERKNRRAALSIALGGLIAPFALGALAGWYSHALLAPAVPRAAYVLFCGIGLSITAVPVLGRIISDLGYQDTPAGSMAMSAAALTDVIGWFMLLAIVAIASAGFDPMQFAGKLALFGAYCLVFSFVVKPLLLRALAILDARGSALAEQAKLAVTLCLVLVSAAATSYIGVHTAFGGFMLGLLLSKQQKALGSWSISVPPLVNILLVPVFFAYTGLNMDLSALFSGQMSLWTGVFIACAIVGKYGGSYVAARASGLAIGDSRVIAMLMNTRGLMELIVLNIGFSLGVIPASVFSMLVLMALVTTMLTSPMLHWWRTRMATQSPLLQDVATENGV
ncbi:cation:proton antiporter [Andreprevotia chitinilytica]|uniref:cation:proton antiporter n=1 Tax=Andreprevotia chitinilytica TaxID=396808 RepID=UPI00068F5E25|nr:cation:proton antiporter [Andreprevotia chitinilytica]